MVDTPVSEAGAARCGGSSPPLGIVILLLIFGSSYESLFLSCDSRGKLCKSHESFGGAKGGVVCDLSNLAMAQP
jgi:hypothetical protein